MTHLQRGWWEGYFWKISALSGPASSDTSPPPFNQRFYFSLTSFISGNEVPIFTAGTLSEGSQSTNQCLTLQEPRFLFCFVFFLLLISPLSQLHYAGCQGGLWNTRANVAKVTGLKTCLQKQMLYNLGFPSFAFKGS